MPHKPLFLALCLVASLAVWGCNNSNSGSGEDEQAHEEHAEHDEHAGHDHGDQPIWMERINEELGDTLVSLGFHGEQPHAGEPLEVVAIVKREDAPIEDATITASLLDADGNVLAEEVSLAFHEAHGGDEAHYDAEGELMVPAEAQSVTVRYNVTLADGASETYDVTVPVLHHEH